MPPNACRRARMHSVSFSRDVMPYARDDAVTQAEVIRREWRRMQDPRRRARKGGRMYELPLACRASVSGGSDWGTQGMRVCVRGKRGSDWDRTQGIRVSECGESDGLRLLIGECWMLRPEIRLLTRASGRARFQRQHVPGREPHKPTLDTVGLWPTGGV